MTTPKPVISIFVHCFPPAKGGVEYLVGEIKKILDQKFTVHVFTGQGLTLDSYKTFSNYIDSNTETRSGPNALKLSHIHRLSLHRQTQRFANKFLHRFVTKFGIFSPFFFGPILQYTPQDIDIIKKSDIIMGFGMPTKSIYDAYVFAKKYQKPLIVLPAYHNVSYYNHSPFFQKAFDYASKIIFLTNFEKQQIIKNYQIIESKTIINTYCPFTINQVQKQAKINTKRKYNFSKPIIGYVGQICPRKNLYIFKDLLDAGYQVLFAGAKTSSSSEIEKYFESYLKSNKLKIIYNFPESDKAKIYSQIDIFINPSIEESLGIVNFEAIYYGTPIIVNQSSAFYDLSPTIPSFDKQIDQHLFKKFFVKNILKQYTIFSSINYDTFSSQLNLLIK
ncbi:MAG: glycosyltransferase family 4 protein [Candidatus Shapirobacteria bacterium]